MKTCILIVFFICISVHSLFAQETQLASDFAFTKKSHGEESVHLKISSAFPAHIQFQFNIIAPAHVQLTIFDVLGKEVFTLVNKQFERGDYNFIWQPENRISGIYIYVFSSGRTRKTGKFLFVNSNR